MIQIIQNLAEICGLKASKIVKRIKDLLVRILSEKGLRDFIKKLTLDIHPEVATYRNILKQE